MWTKPLAVLPVLAGLLALGACDEPKSRPPAPDIRGTPPAPAWAQAVIGQPLRRAFPKAGACIGNTDGVLKRYAGSPPGVQINGWGWDSTRRARIERVLLVDRTATIVGGGEGGAPRQDVPRARPEITDANSGWLADAPARAGPLDAYGITAGDAVCALGRLEF